MTVAVSYEEKSSTTIDMFASHVVGAYGFHISKLVESARTVGVPNEHIVETIRLLKRLDELALAGENEAPVVLPSIKRCVSFLLSNFHNYVIAHIHGMGNPYAYEGVLARVRASAEYIGRQLDNIRRMKLKSSGKVRSENHASRQARASHSPTS